MKFVIGESQRKELLKESILSDLENTLSSLKDFGLKTLNDAKQMLNFDIRFLLTWSATIGGFMGPLTDFVMSENPDLSREEVSTIAIGVCAFLFYNNKELGEKIYNTIKEKGLSDTFKSAMSKGNELKKALKMFLKSIGVTTQNMTHVAAFTFLVPVVGHMATLISGGELTDGDLDDVVKRVVAAGVTYVSASFLKNLFSKISERIG